MAVNITLSPRQSSSVTVKPNKTSVSTLNLNSPKANNLYLGELKNVDASNPQDNYLLAYDTSVQKYVVKEFLITSNNITGVDGGTF